MDVIRGITIPDDYEVRGVTAVGPLLIEVEPDLDARSPWDTGEYMPPALSWSDGELQVHDYDDTPDLACPPVSEESVVPGEVADLGRIQELLDGADGDAGYGEWLWGSAPPGEEPGPDSLSNYLSERLIDMEASPGNGADYLDLLGEVYRALGVPTMRCTVPCYREGPVEFLFVLTPEWCGRVMGREFGDLDDAVVEKAWSGCREVVTTWVTGDIYQAEARTPEGESVDAFCGLYGMEAVQDWVSEVVDCRLADPVVARRAVGSVAEF